MRRIARVLGLARGMRVARRVPMTPASCPSFIVVLGCFLVCAASARAQDDAALTARFDELERVMAQPGAHPAALRCELGSLMTQLRRGLPLDQLDPTIRALGQLRAPADRAVLARCLYL